MRRALLLIPACAFVSIAPVVPTAFAQDDPQYEYFRQMRAAQESGMSPLPLPQASNAGPCPTVKVLYDAARYLEFKDGKESADAVVYTGEIEGLEAVCTYRTDQPIKMQIRTTFSLGRGPQATSAVKDYGYWIAVTARNKQVLARERFGVQARFPQGGDRVVVHDLVADITIPRAAATVSGSNFEVLVGFDQTPQTAAFNREGARFRIDAGKTAPFPGQ